MNKNKKSKTMNENITGGTTITTITMTIEEENAKELVRQLNEIVDDKK